MKKNISAISLPKNAQLPTLNPSSPSFSSIRPHPEGFRSVRATNSNLQPIPHEQSFDSILKRYHGAPEYPKTTERALNCSLLSIHSNAKAAKRNKLREVDLAGTERVRRNLEVLREKYILLPEISRKSGVAKLENRFEEEGDYEDYGRTALQLKKLKKKAKRDNEKEK
jgi:hypothetical protein